jgi:DNA polymerase III subunit alpha
VNKAVLESLVCSGAFDTFGRARAQLAQVLENAIERGTEARKDRRMGQTTLFDLFGSGEPENGNGGAKAAMEEQYPEMPEWPDAEKLSREKKALGFYLTGHPLIRWEGLVRKYGTHDSSDIATLADGTAVILGAQIAKLTKKVSKRTGGPFWIAVAEDLKGSIEIFITQEQHEAAKDFLKEESLVFLKGSIRYRDTTPSLRVDAIIPFADAPAKLTEDLSLVVPAEEEKTAEDLLFRLKDLFRRNRGRCPVYIVFRAGGEKAILLVGSEHYVAPNPDFLDAAEGLCGRERVLVNRMGRR